MQNNETPDSGFLDWFQQRLEWKRQTLGEQKLSEILRTQISTNYIPTVRHLRWITNEVYF